MKQYPKIDIYFAEDYLCTTTRSRTCKEAKARFLESCDFLAKTHLVERQISKNKHLVKANFQK